MSLTKQQAVLRGSLGAAVRHHPETADAIRRELKASRAEDYVRRLVDEAPLLTHEQCDRLAVLLRPSAA